MSRLREVGVVAGWEFRRYFKWKDQLISLAIFFLVGAVWAGAAAVAGSSGRPVTVALADLDLAAPAEGRLRFVTAPEDRARHEGLLREGEVHGVLSRGPDGRFELVVARDPRYRVELARLLGDVVRQERLAAAGLPADALPALMAPAALTVRFLDAGRQRLGGGEKVAAGVGIVVMLIAIFTSLAYLFTGITGEKQLRVTESVIAAIPPQSWIDGKVVGITGYALASTATVVLGGTVVAVGAWLATGFTVPAAVRPSVLLTLAAFTLLGLLLWNSFFAAVAATIDDPNTSSRSSLLFVPMVPVVLSLAVVRDPESAVSRVLALFPLTSAPALPVRLILADPHLLEVLAAALLLAAAIWLMRRAAGRIFEVGMLMYGKEPTGREVMRWLRDRPSPAAG